MAGKRPEDMTPTELFARDNYGAEPGPPPIYDRFRQMVGSAGSVAGDAIGKFQEWKNANPAAKWATEAAPMLMHPAAGMIRGASAAGKAAAAPEPAAPTTRDPVSFERDPPTATPAQLPDAPPAAAPAMPTYKMSPGMGPGGDVYRGYGTDKGVLDSQLNTYDDMAGLQEKKGEEYTARLASMKSAADMEREVARQQQAGAAAYKTAVDSEDKRQAMQEEKIQRSADEAAAAGIDPGRFFKNRDAGFWINMMVGSIASGMLSARPGGDGRNTFMESINATVGQDIKAQETAIDQGWKKVRGNETAYERMRLSGVDKVTATLKQADMTLQALQSDIKGRLMASQIPEEKARLEGALQVLQIERDKNMTTIQETWRATRESRARAAAASAMSAHAAERQARLDKDEHDYKRSQTEKNYAEADKLRAGDPADKELAKDARAFGVHTAYLTSHEVLGLAKDAAGSSTSKTPIAHLPWQTDGRAYKQHLDDYNAEVNTMLGHWMKIEAGKVPVGEFNNIVHRFELTPQMTDPEKAARIKGLKSWVDERAKTSGVAGPVPKGVVTGMGDIPSFKPNGG